MLTTTVVLVVVYKTTYQCALNVAAHIGATLRSAPPVYKVQSHIEFHIETVYQACWLHWWLHSSCQCVLNVAAHIGSYIEV